jgi:2-polyprenyl-6-methoxyphenol hydroxylase-like FAD-dependent oxidoreductase
MQESQTRKIIIIGGGIGGLMAAIALNEKGITSTIYEKSDGHPSSGAGLTLWANATAILQKFGLLEKLLPYSNVLDEMLLMTSSANLLNRVHLSKLEEAFKYHSIVIQRKDLLKILMDAVLQSNIHFKKECISIEKKLNKIQVHFADRTTEESDAVIFADGVHSYARKKVFNFPPLKYAGRTSWRGIAQFDKQIFPLHQNYEIFGRGKRIGIFLLPGNCAYWYAAVNMSVENASLQKRTVEGVLSHFKNWCEPVNTVVNNTKEDRLILTNILFAPHINKLVDGNIALLGDAAHPMTPDLGQGACQAIEDAFMLAECVSENNFIEEAFAAYEKKRIERVQFITTNSYRMGKLRQMGNPVSVSIRNNIFRFMPEHFALKMLKRSIYTKASNIF